jgi:GT2 family glycosyltransferase
VEETGATYIFDDSGVAKALHLGVQKARAPVVITLPADARVAPGWLEHITRPVREDRAHWAAGPAIGAGEDHTPVWHYFETRTRAFYANLKDGDALPSGLPGWNTCYRRATLLELGSFDPQLPSSEDWDMHLRLNMAGRPGLYVQDAAIHHDHPHTIGQLYRREVWYKRGQIRVGRKHGQSVAGIKMLTPAVYALLFVLTLVSFFSRIIALATILLWTALIIRQWSAGVAQNDPKFWARPLLRLVEGVAGLMALAKEFGRPSSPPPQKGL